MGIPSAEATVLSIVLYIERSLTSNELTDKVSSIILLRDRRDMIVSDSAMLSVTAFEIPLAVDVKVDKATVLLIVLTIPLNLPNESPTDTEFSIVLVIPRNLTSSDSMDTEFVIVLSCPLSLMN